METPEGKDPSSPTRPWSTRRRIVLCAASVMLLALTAGGYALGANRAKEDDATQQDEARRPGGTQVRPVTTSRSTSTSAVAETEPPTSTTSTVATAPERPPASTAVPNGPEYAFPIQPATGVTYDPSHHDYPAADMFAECGTEVVAPHAGVIQDVSYQDNWSSSRDTPESRGGLSFSIVGDDGVRYYGSHLESLDPAVRPGAHVASRQRIGTVGETGNARGTGCHLHFGISTPCGPGDVLRRRGEFRPQDFLDAWREGEQISPADLPDPSSC